MTTSHKKHGPMRAIVYFGLIALAITMLSRIGLGIWQADRVAAVEDRKSVV